MAECIWNTITTVKLEDSINFYQNLLGLKISKRMMPNASMELVFLADKNGFEIELIDFKTGNVSASAAPANLSMGFNVASLDEMMNVMTSHGVAIERGPIDAAGFRFCFVKDPNGVTVQFVEKK